MCLIISQNAPGKLDADVKDWETNEPLLYPKVREENKVAKESSLVSSKSKKREEVQNEDTKEMEEKKKKRKKIHKEDSRRMEEEEKEMKEHESFLFGCLYSLNEFDTEEEARSCVNNGPLFFTDCSGNGGVKVYEDENSDTVETREPAWVDDEEKAITVNIAQRNRLRKLRTEEDEELISGLDYDSRSRAQFVKLNPGTEWAQLGDLIDDERNEGILQTNEEVVVKSNVKLLPGLLEYSRLADVNSEEYPFKDAISSVQFHRNAQLLLAAGLDKGLRLFQIDGKRNTKVDSATFEDCPIRKAAFLPDGSQIIVSGRRKFFYTYDLPNAKKDKVCPLVGRDEKSLETFEISPDSRTIAFVGNEGHILLVSTRTKELIGTLKMNGSVRCLAFADNGRQLVSCGGDGHIYHWDMRTRRCFHKGVDEGCIMGSSLGASPAGALFAAGSSSGIVNVYNQHEFLGGKRKPLKTIENLTTKVDFVKFNHDAQIMAICSSMQKNGLKLVHVPSFSVFSNWPHPKGTLHHPRCLDFSPGGGFMAMGNAAGTVFLYKLHHYQRA